jgi:hypothetical protein
MNTDMKKQKILLLIRVYLRLSAAKISYFFLCVFALGRSEKLFFTFIFLEENDDR